MLCPAPVDWSTFSVVFDGSCPPVGGQVLVQFGCRKFTNATPSRFASFNFAMCVGSEHCRRFHPKPRWGRNVLYSTSHR